MPRRVVFTAGANSDVDEAFAWYEAQDSELGAYFTRRLVELIDTISGMPLSYPPRAGAFRRGLMKNFPYAVYFQILEEKIVIAAIVHSARNPRLVSKLLMR